MKHIINGISFKSDKSLQEYAKNILYSNRIPTCLIEDEFDFMIDYFLKNHIEFQQKKGCGIAQVWRIKEPNYGKFRAFQIERIDGSRTDISYILSNIKKKNLESEFKSALRKVIEPQVHTFKTNAFEKTQSLICPLSNELVYYQNSHVDHFEPTFNELVNQFISKYDIIDYSKYIAASTDNQTFYELSCSDIASKFFDFHQKYANLRILSPKGNLSIAKRSL